MPLPRTPSFRLDGRRALLIGAGRGVTRPFFEDAAFKADVLRRIKLGRFGQVEDLMGVAIFLGSDASA